LENRQIVNASPQQFLLLHYSLCVAEKEAFKSKTRQISESKRRPINRDLLRTWSLIKHWEEENPGDTCIVVELTIPGFSLIFPRVLEC